MSALLDVGLPKWPQMIVSGRSVTAEQAKDIIFRTDSFLTDPYEFSGGNARAFNAEYKSKCGFPSDKSDEDHWKKLNAINELLEKEFGLVKTYFVCNNWASCAFIMGPHGWCSPTGEIKYVDNIGKWPSVDGVLKEWTLIAEAFPYLDLEATLMSDEEGVEGSKPLVNFIVKDGSARVSEPDLDHASRMSFKRDMTNTMPSLFLLPAEIREIGLPREWYDEFASSVRSVLKKHGFAT